MGFFSRLIKPHQSENNVYTPNSQIRYAWEDKTYTNASNKYFSGMEIIETTWSVLYNLNCYTGERAESFIKLCKKNIEDFYIWNEINHKYYNEESAPAVPAFKRLAMIYEKQGLYEDSISVCKEAIICGAHIDGSKGGMKGRLARMIKKAGRSPTEDELLILDSQSSSLSTDREEAINLFSNKNNQLLAAQYLKILKESADIVNQTKNPDTFFQRYSLAEEQADKLCKLKGIEYTGQHPQQIKQQLSGKRQSAIHDMIDRYFSDTAQKALKLKTVSGKLNKFSSFITVLEDYYDLMDDENIQYVNILYNNSISDLKAQALHSETALKEL